MIPFKKQETKTIEYITKEEFQAILNQCDDSTYLGLRDKVMLMILYNTGIIDNSVSKYKPSNDLLEFLSKL